MNIELCLQKLNAEHFRRAFYSAGNPSGFSAEKAGYAVSTTYPVAQADDGNRTRLPSLGSWYSTDELHLHGKYYNTFTNKMQDLFSLSAVCRALL